MTPLGLWRLLGRPMHELANEVPSLDALSVPALAGLPERLDGLRDWPARFAAVDAVLLGLLERGSSPSPEVAYAWSVLERCGEVRVADLAAATGWSRRHLLTRFREQVGVAPKLAGRVLRFSRASGLVLRDVGLSDVAATCGYFDHAHLDR
jgi:AraC-like DNA-binding protein